MLFNSYEFIFLFLPVTFSVYFFLNKRRLTVASKSWLVLCSLFYYSWWNPAYLPLILLSILFNFTVGNLLSKKSDHNPRGNTYLLVFGIAANIALLGYFKYMDFFINNLNSLFSLHIKPLNLVLPLAISFFTFQQIAYLVDSYRKETKEYDFLNYTLFVSFASQLIAGPIVHHKEMMPQFKRARNKIINYRNVSAGLFLFFMGLFKKVIVADTFSTWVIKGYDNAAALTLLDGWATSLSYTLQLYFDFSGYTDMALGTALLFNIKLPLNFNSPYKAASIRDFWRKWHMTLSRFLRDYIYIPLGGNRKGRLRLYINIMVTFLIGGIWHGAGWTFIFWGFLHGLALVIQRLWEKSGFRLNAIIAWFITFNFLNFTWVFFRARQWSDALNILKAMFGFKGIVLPDTLANIPFLSDYGISFGSVLTKIGGGYDTAAMLIVFLFLSLFAVNSMELVKRFKPNWKYGLAGALLMSISIVYIVRKSEFIYFQF